MSFGYQPTSVKKFLLDGEDCARFVYVREDRRERKKCNIGSCI